MWRRAVRWVYQVWPDDPEGGRAAEVEPVKTTSATEPPTNGDGHNNGHGNGQNNGHSNGHSNGQNNGHGDD
jgi:hypothetical protein